MGDLATAKMLQAALAKAVELRKTRAIDFVRPYDKQKAHFALGATKIERLLMAGNQQGKTYAGAVETTYHLTGEYPDWWTGRRFMHPVRAWVCCETGLLVRDGPQTLLCGPAGVEGAMGSGLIPKAAFVGKPSMARGVTDLYDTIQVYHKTNGIIDGISTLTSKSYEQGRAKFQSTTLDFVWLDEECDMEIYSECIARTMATQGMVWMTFTPMEGMSSVVKRFVNEPSPDRSVTIMTTKDALHTSQEEWARRIALYPAHEREARANGVPMHGEGRIFLTDEATLREKAIEYVPEHWFKLWGLDFGIAHPFAAVLLLWDKDNDVIHVHHCIRIADQMPLQHAVPMKRVGAAVPVAWPHDGAAREAGSGESLASLYKAQKLVMLPDHATHPDGGYSTEAGIMEMDDRMKTGRLKVAEHLADWWEEYRQYHRAKGLIVKTWDDLLSATRVGVMMKRFARQVPLGDKLVLRRNGDSMASGVDFEMF